VGNAVSEANEYPGPYPVPGGRSVRSNAIDVAPHPERDDEQVESREAQGGVRADEIARESRRCKHLIEAEEVFLKRVGCLSND